MAKSIFLPTEVEVLIVSAGGVGTTFLMDAIGKYRHVNRSDNKDGFKHLPIPPLTQNKKVKAIYVYGDPIMATVSLFRRKYHHTQSIVTQYFHATDFVIPFEMDLPTYVKRGEDALFFERHFKNWQQLPTSYPILFLSYSAIHDELETIRDYLDLPEEFVTSFPPRRTRKSSLEELPVSTLTGLKKMYGNWQKEQEGLPNSQIIIATASSFPYTDVRYRRGYMAGLKQRWPWLRKVFRF